MKKFLSLFIAIILTLSNLIACSQNTKMQTNTTNKEISIASTAYYSVTASQARSEKNHFMELNVKIPSIVCSEETSNDLFNTINEEIKNNINKLVDEAITTAENTYQAYITTVKTNLEQERENKIIALKNKYKSILGDDEVKAMSEVINSDIENFSNDNIHISATPSFTNIEGFTNSENLIIPELHNKNIIIVETTEKETDISQTTMAVEGKPGRQNRIVQPEKNTDNNFHQFNQNDYSATPKNNTINENNNNENLTENETTNTNNKNSTEDKTTNTNTDNENSTEDKTTNTNTDNENSTKDKTTNTDNENLIKDKTTNTDNENLTESETTNNNNKFSSNDDILEPKKFEKEHYGRKDIDNSNNRFGRKNFPPKRNIKNNEEKIENFDIQNENSNLQEITKENFYIELEKIKKLKMPNKFKLAKDYIPTSIYCGFDVKCLDEDYLSLFIELSETRITSSSKRFYYNIDLKNKKLISIKDILGDDFKNISIQCINNSIENWSEEKKKDLIENYKIDKFINENVDFFINNNHIPVVALEKNTILTSGAGYPEFQITK